MELSFWQERWLKGETGFHQTTLNPYLAYLYGEKGADFKIRSSLKVFVPLCGKSLDMQWLSQNGYAVLGVECSPLAVREFLENIGAAYEVAETDKYVKYSIKPGPTGSASLEIIQGDFFELTDTDVAGVTDVFDRASLIALPEAMRKNYADKMSKLLAPGVRVLLITLTYPQHEMEGPPFSVSEEEVHELYGKDFKIEKILAKNILSTELRFQQRGLTALLETAYKLTRK